MLISTSERGEKKETGGLNRTPVSVGSESFDRLRTRECAWSGEEIIIKMKLQSRYGETIYK